MADRPVGSNERRLVLVVCIFLAVIIFAVFGKTCSGSRVRIMTTTCMCMRIRPSRRVDPQGNRLGVHTHSSNWHPLTWISHMLDWQIVWAECRRTSLHQHPDPHGNGDPPFPGAAADDRCPLAQRLCGCVFAIHPLRVESVAWVAERKDVLSGLCFMLTLWAYVRYARRPCSFGRYWLVASSRWD